MINGIQLDYALKRGMSSRFNQVMFGRISTRRDGDKIYAYYIPGVLDEIKHYRIFEGRVFIGTVNQADFDPVMKFCTKFVVSSSSKEEKDVFMKTGRNRWKFHAKERGLEVGWY